MALAEAALQALEPNIRTYIEGLESSLQATEIRYDHLKEEYRLLVYKRFARSAEQIDTSQEELFAEAETESEVEESCEETLEVAAHTRKKRGRKIR